ncbi:RNA methyltransferase [Myxococcota bacterium]|nr:RNA methyltransferase [Myxococcota bacterium]
MSTFDDLRARLIPVEDPADPRVADYREVREAELVLRRGVFLAEGTEVVRTLVRRGRFPVRSILLADKLVDSMTDVIAEAPRHVPIYVASRAVMSAIAGFDIHRGCLAAGLRGELPSLDAIVGAPTIDRGPSPEVFVAAEGLANHDNVGGLFRNAAAFGARGVLLDPRSADPLYRKAIRVSMGTSLTLPWTRVEPWPDALDTLRAAGFAIWALALGEGSRDLAAHVARPVSPLPRRIVLLAGTEGTGLTDGALARVTDRWVIPMAPGVDSLNVSTATGVALFALATLSKSPVP